MVSRENRGGWEWTLAPSIPPEALEHLRAAFPDLGSLPGTTILKENRQRSVFRVDPGAIPGAREIPALRDGVVAKHYRYVKAWDRQRYRFLPSRAEQEWRALLRFEAAGIPTGAPLAVAAFRRGGVLEGGGLLVRCLPDAVPLSEKLRSGASAPQLIADAGALVRRMHDAGIRHRDLHAENLLVCGPEERIHIIDLHSALFRRRVSARARRLGLARLVQSLWLIVREEHLGLLVDAYGPDVLGRGGADRARDRIRRRADALERTRVRSRSKRCFVPSTSFDVIRRPGERLYHARSHSPAEIDAISRAGPGSLREAEPGEGGWTGVARTSAGEVRVRRRSHGALERMASLVLSHPLRRAYAAGHALRVRRIPTPRVIALRERRRLGMVIESDLFTESAPDSATLEDHLVRGHAGRERASGERARAKLRLAVACGELVRNLHAAGCLPPNLSPRALRVSCAEGRPRVEIADLEGARFRKRISARLRRRNLIRAASFPGGPVSAQDLLRAYRAYAGSADPCTLAGEIRRISRGLVAERLRALEERLVEERGAREPEPVRPEA